MFIDNLKKLEHLSNTIPSLLKEIDEDSFCSTPEADKWSKKQILGHLIDSATNNHHRWIRAQFEIIPFISYDQNQWNKFSYYDQMPTSQLIAFWTIYNLQIIELIKLIPYKNLQKLCNMGNQQVTLEWLFNDYIEHLEHHLKQITEYP